MLRSGMAMGWVVVMVGSAVAQTSYPMITHCTPTAVRRGTTVEVTVEGQMNFAGAHKVIIEGSGVTAEVIPPAPPAKGQTPPPLVRSVKLKVTADRTAAVGVREFRLATSLGISTLGQLVVTADPVVLEAGDNNTRDKAQKVDVNSVVSGRIEALEDVDCYRFSAKAGTTITFEVTSARIQDKIHDLQKHADPILTLFQKDGKELASNDDGRFADPLLAYTIPADGEYVVEIRDSKFDGDVRWAYALAMTDRAYAAQVFPMAGNPGAKLKVEPVGSAGRAGAIEITLPNEVGVHSLPLRSGNDETNPVAFVVTNVPTLAEQEPNDTPSSAGKLVVPGGVSGRIGAKRDLDHYRIAGTKGKAVRLEVTARRFGTDLTSRLDGVLDVLNSAGAVVATNDDLNGKDPGLVFTPPADGEYVVRIRDLNNSGGPGHTYYLEADYAQPDFTIKCDPSKAMIGPGSRGAWFVQVVRNNGFTGAVTVDVSGLPKGVTVNPLTIPPTMTQGLLVVSAAKDAPLDAATIQITGRAESTVDGKPVKLVRRATPVEEIYMPGGGRGRFDVRMQTLAVTGPTDIVDVIVKPEKLVLKPGDEVTIDVEIKRRADYDKTVSIDIPLRHLGQVFGNPLPPGVTVVEGKSKTLLGTGSVGKIVLKVDPSAAPIDDVPIAVLAHVSINFVVKVSYSSAPILISIRK